MLNIDGHLLVLLLIFCALNAYDVATIRDAWLLEHCTAYVIFRLEHESRSLLLVLWGELHGRDHHRIVLRVELLILGLLLVAQVVARRWSCEIAMHHLRTRFKKLVLAWLRLFEHLRGIVESQVAATVSAASTV